MADKNLFPEILAIELYKHNSIDNRLFTLIMDNSRVKFHDGTYLVRSQDIRKIISQYFKHELQKIDVLSHKNLYKNANTIYFLHTMLKDMKNLRWFQIRYNKNLAYNRLLIDSETGEKVINFDFKVIRGTFKTYDYFSYANIKMVNKILLEAGCFKRQHYSTIKLPSLINYLEGKKGSTKDEEVVKICYKLISYLKDWKEDEPLALIVTDFLDI